MKTLADRMQLAKTVLDELNRRHSRRVEIEQIAIRKGATHARFDGILHYLADSGFIHKTDVTRFSKYGITEKACTLLEALQ